MTSSSPVNVKYGENNVNAGPLKELGEICVDHFHGEDLKSTAFFLTHAHTDHMVGLEGRNFVKRLNEPGIHLYCHLLTPVLLTSFQRYLGGQEGQEDLIRRKKLVPLETGKSYNLKIPSKSSKRDDLKFLNVTVTLLPAGHCPGSVMFMFETESVRILHTGDFRQSVEELKSISHLHSHEGQGAGRRWTRQPKTIDHLYIDTTFCTAAYGSLFPCRKQVIQKAIGHVREWVTQSVNNWIFVKFAAKFAHEYILLEIHKTFGKKIHVMPQRHAIYSVIPGLDKVTTLDRRTPFHFCDNRNCIDEGQSLEMRLSSMWYTLRSNNNTGTGQRRKSEHFGGCDTVLRTPKRLSVCYSMHPSMQEIVDTIDYLKPRVVTPLVMPFASNLHEVKEALRKNCKTSFVFEDYRSQGEVINPRTKPGTTRSSKQVTDNTSVTLVSSTSSAYAVSGSARVKSKKIIWAEDIDPDEVVVDSNSDSELDPNEEGPGAKMTENLASTSTGDKKDVIRDPLVELDAFEEQYQWVGFKSSQSPKKVQNRDSESQNSYETEDADYSLQQQTPTRKFRSRYRVSFSHSPVSPTTPTSPAKIPEITDIPESKDKNSYRNHDHDLIYAEDIMSSNISTISITPKRKLEESNPDSPASKKLTFDFQDKAQAKNNDNDIIDLTVDDDSETDFETQSSSSSSQNSQSLLSPVK